MEIRRRFFYRRHPHYPYCGCYDEIYPWYPWEIMDDPLWRMSPSGRYNSRIISDTNVSNRIPGSNSRQSIAPRQRSILRWLPWPWRSSTESSTPLGHSDNGTQTNGTCGGGEAGLRDRLSTDARVRDRLTVSTTTRNVRTAANRRLEDRTIGDSNQNGHALHHRRRRSNDTVLHHLNLVNRYQHLLVANQRGRNVYTSTQFGEFSLPVHMWGPPPPYPHSPIVEVAHHNTNNRRTRSSNEPCQRSIEEQTENGTPVSAPLIDMVQSIESSEAFSIVDETKRRTPDVELNGGEIHILTVDVHPTREYITEETEDKDDRQRSCLVEIHVPYNDEIIPKKDEIKNNVSSFTLPLRHSRKLADITPFKSLSNIPLYLTNKLKHNSEDNCNLDETNMELLEESLMQKLCQFSDDSIVPGGTYVLTDGVLSTLCSSSNGSPLSDNMVSSLEFGPTIVELFTDYKSRIVIATTPCTPVHDDVPLGESACVTRSMPNLYCSICADSGPATASNSCCSGSASSIGCSTTSLPDDIFSLEESSTVHSAPPHHGASTDNLPVSAHDSSSSSSDKDNHNGNPMDYLLSSSSSNRSQTIKRRRKRSRAVVIRQNAVIDSSSSSDYNETLSGGGGCDSSATTGDTIMWLHYQGVNRNRRHRTTTAITKYSSDSRRTTSRSSGGEQSNVSFISVNQT